jgi:hypothetical protein
VRVEHEDDEKPERLGSEICRHITKVYGVESAELSHFTPVEE